MSLSDDLDEEMTNAAACIDALRETVRKWELVGLRMLEYAVRSDDDPGVDPFNPKGPYLSEVTGDALALLRLNRSQRLDAPPRPETPNAPTMLQDGELMTVWQIEERAKAAEKRASELQAANDEIRARCAELEREVSVLRAANRVHVTEQVYPHPADADAARIANTVAREVERNLQQDAREPWLQEPKREAV